MADWLRETLRGEVEVIDQSMAHLKSRLDRDIARAKFPFFLNILVIESSGRHLLGGFSNVVIDTPGTPGRVVDRFEYSMQELPEPAMFANAQVRHGPSPMATSRAYRNC